MRHSLIEAVEFSRVPDVRVVGVDRALPLCSQRIGVGFHEVTHAHIDAGEIRRGVGDRGPICLSMGTYLTEQADGTQKVNQRSHSFSPFTGRFTPVMA